MKPQRSWLPRVILGLALVMVLAGFILHGVRPANFQRGWQNLLARPGQSLALRFILQPTVSTILAIRDGIKDARAGRPPYLWSMLTDPADRLPRLRDGLTATGKIFLIAIALDVVYQLIELTNFHPVEALIIAIFLAFIPYLLVRGPVTRLARHWQRYKTEEPLA